MMNREEGIRQSRRFLKMLSEIIGDRSVGSEGNRRATDFFGRQLEEAGWSIRSSELKVMDWEDGGATLRAGHRGFPVRPSPYSRGCRVTAPLIAAGNTGELRKVDAGGKVLLLHGEIAGEQLVPKNYAFFNPESHREIVSLLEQKEPAAIVCATQRNPSLAGGVYPFPLIEDGDFDIPSVYTTEKTGMELLPLAGSPVLLNSDSRRLPTRAWNVAAHKKGEGRRGRIVLTAHIDSKKGTPGALDNATGVTVLLLLAGMWRKYRGPGSLEIVAFNGEDYYSAPGQMDYIRRNRDQFSEMDLNINIDGPGYRQGPSSFSLLGMPDSMKTIVQKVIGEFPDITEDPPWPQGDHSIFLQQGVPALAVSSHWLISHMESQDITHTPRDHSGIVDPVKLVEIAHALDRVVRDLYPDLSFSSPREEIR